MDPDKEFTILGAPVVGGPAFCRMLYQRTLEERRMSEETANIDRIAQVTHEANRAYCATIGDNSQVAWDDAPDWQRESAIAGVRATVNGEANSPQEQHESWARQKVADGWIYGPYKDAQAKTHPCLVAYDELPVEQRRKDHLFRAIVVALTSDIG